MKSSLIWTILVLATSIAFAQPVAVQGAIEDDRFLAICEDAAMGKVESWRGYFSVVESGKESPFIIDRTELDNAPAQKADRRSVLKLVQQGLGLKQTEGRAKEVAWFAYQGKEGLEILINLPLGKYERDLLGQVQEDGQDWVAWAIYFVGGDGDRNSSWIVCNETHYTWISCGKTNIQQALFLLNALGVIR